MLFSVLQFMTKFTAVLCQPDFDVAHPVLTNPDCAVVTRPEGLEENAGPELERRQSVKTLSYSCCRIV